MRVSRIRGRSRSVDSAVSHPLFVLAGSVWLFTSWRQSLLYNPSSEVSEENFKRACEKHLR